MAHQNFKVSLIIPNEREETIVLKHYVDAVYPCFEQFKEKIFVRFPDVRTKKYKIYWIDNENDTISIFNEEDFRFYVDSESNSKIYFKIIDDAVPSANSTDASSSGTKNDNQPDQNTTKENQNYHEGVICDGCDGKIYGFRYKCITCVDYDLCMKCESKQMHKDHGMIRINEPINRLKFGKRFFKTYRSSSKRHCNDNGETGWRSEQRDGSPSAENRHHRTHEQEHEAFIKNLHGSDLVNHLIRHNITVNLDNVIGDINKRKSASSSSTGGCRKNSNADAQKQQQPSTSSANNNDADMKNKDDTSKKHHRHHHHHRRNGGDGKQFAENVAKAGYEIFSNIVHNFPVILDPFGNVHTDTENEEKTKPSSNDTKPSTGINITIIPTTDVDSNIGAKKDSVDKNADESIMKEIIIDVDPTNENETNIPNYEGAKQSDDHEIDSIRSMMKKARSDLEAAILKVKQVQSDFDAEQYLNTMKKLDNLELHGKTLNSIDDKMNMESNIEKIVEKAATIEDLLDDNDDDDIIMDSQRKQRNSPNISKDWTVVDADGLIEEQKTNKVTSTGAIPKPATTTSTTTTTNNWSTISSSSSSSAASVVGDKINVPDYKQMADELKKFIDENVVKANDKMTQADSMFAEENLACGGVSVSMQQQKQQQQQQQCQQQSQSPPQSQQASAPLHPNKAINDALVAMIGMGFSNEGGWLSQLLESVDGNISKALDLLQPHK